MPCVAALIVLGFLSIFSAKYRSLARDAVDCVFKRVTLRPCTTGFDVKIKSTILSKLLLKSPTMAKWVSKQYELISWAFVLTFLMSLLWTGKGVYLFWSTGNCNGLNQGGFCAFDPTGKNNAVSGTAESCNVGGDLTGDLTLDGVDLSSFYSVSSEVDKDLIFIGCYDCEYTHETYPLIKQLIEKYRPRVSYVFYPAHRSADYLMAYDYCVQKEYGDKYLGWVEAMYGQTLEQVEDESTTVRLIESLGIDTKEINSCLNSETTKLETQKRLYEIDKTGIYGTPTVFLNGTAVVGPKPYRVYRRLLNKSWF